MNITGFDDAFTLLIGREGKYSNNPRDPGGETMWGITIKTARRNGYYGDMRQLPLQMAKQIAKREYWDVISGDQLPPELAFQVFDMQYNGGPAAKTLQRALGVEEDGWIGPQTIAAAKSADLPKTIARFDAYRLLYLCDLATWPDFGKGWARRIANNLLEGTD